MSDEAVEKMLEESLEHAFEDMNDRIFDGGEAEGGRAACPPCATRWSRSGSELDADERRVDRRARR